MREQPAPYQKHLSNGKPRGWYVNLHGHTIPLATEDEGEVVARAKYHQLMAEGQPLPADCTVGSLLDKYAGHVERGLAPGTFKIRKPILESFLRYIGNLRLSALKVHHVSEWLAEYPKASTTYKHTLGRTIKAALSWAVDEGHIDASPIKRLKLATPTSRDVYLNSEQWDKLMALVAKARDQGCLFDLLMALSETGARPQEVRTIEARWLNRNRQLWVFPTPKSKGKAEPRVVRLTPGVWATCERLAMKFPEGPIFRNSDGKPWTRHALAYRLYRLSKRLGFPVTAYSVRHSFATNAILRGVDLVSIAMLMGHKDLKMLSRVYQHVMKCGDHMQAALNKAVGQ